MDEPVCTRASVSASSGGKVQIVRYRIDANYFYSMSRDYEIPPDWDEETLDKWQMTKLLHLREQIEGPAQAEADDLMEQMD